MINQSRGPPAGVRLAGPGLCPSQAGPLCVGAGLRVSGSPSCSQSDRLDITPKHVKYIRFSFLVQVPAAAAQEVLDSYLPGLHSLVYLEKSGRAARQRSCPPPLRPGSAAELPTCGGMLVLRLCPWPAAQGSHSDGPPPQPAWRRQALYRVRLRLGARSLLAPSEPAGSAGPLECRAVGIITVTMIMITTASRVFLLSIHA